MRPDAASLSLNLYYLFDNFNSGRDLEVEPVAPEPLVDLDLAEVDTGLVAELVNTTDETMGKGCDRPGLQELLHRLGGDGQTELGHDWVLFLRDKVEDVVSLFVSDVARQSWR